MSDEYKTEQQSKSAASNILNCIRTFNPNSISRLDLGNGNDFEFLLDTVKGIFDLTKSINDEAFLMMPFSSRESFTDTASKYMNNLSNMKDFDINGNVRHDGLVKSFRENADLLYKELRGIALTCFSSLDEAKNTLIKVRTIVKQIDEAGAKVIVSNEAQKFAIEAKKHINNAKKWLIAIIIIASIMLSILVWAYVDINPHHTINNGMISSLLIRGAILSLLAFVLKFCIRNRDIQLHRGEGKSEKANVVKIYKPLVEAMSTPGGKDVLLMKVADSVFCHQPTGYTKYEVSDGNPSIISPVDLVEKLSKIKGHSQ